MSSTSSLFAMDADEDPFSPLEDDDELMNHLRAHNLAEIIQSHDNNLSPPLVGVAIVMKTVDAPGDGSDCPICLDGGGGGGDDSWKETACGHRFHAGCVEKWAAVKGRSSCPMCRQEMMSPAELLERDIRALYCDDELVITVEMRQLFADSLRQLGVRSTAEAEAA
uniref:RING-type domain-containing protein n=1 Tax=Leersia perrieri TaxID=77586 RepID=A0A0D9WLQ8_9ORYZ